MATKRGRAWRVPGGVAAMVAFVAVVLALLVRQAGAWRVPYFSFTSAHGSHRTNDFTGYTCEPLTPADGGVFGAPALAEVGCLGDLGLADDTTVLTGSYRATHDYQRAAQLAVPARSAEAAAK